MMIKKAIRNNAYKSLEQHLYCRTTPCIVTSNLQIFKHNKLTLIVKTNENIVILTYFLKIKHDNISNHTC